MDSAVLKPDRRSVSLTEKSLKLILDKEIKTTIYKEFSPDIKIKDGVETLRFLNEISIDAEHEKKISTKSETKCWERFLGMTLMALASLFFSSSVVGVKGQRGKYQVYSVAMWTLFGGCFLMSIPILLYLQFFKKSSPFGSVFPLTQVEKRKTFCALFVRSLLGSVAIVFQYSALAHLSMPDTTVICFSTPVFVTFLACCILKEKFGLMNLLAVFVTLLGVVIITRPTFLTGEKEMDTKTMIGVGLAMTSMTLSAFVFITLRILKEVHFSLVTFSYGLVCSISCFCLSEIFGKFEVPDSLWDFQMASVSSFFTFAAQVAMTAAFKFDDAGPLSLIRSFDVIFAFIWQAIFFHEEPDKYSIIGAAVILSGVIFIGLRKHVSSLPEDHRLRKMCCCILK